MVPPFLRVGGLCTQISGNFCFTAGIAAGLEKRIEYLR
jgi:hypothetical protein